MKISRGKTRKDTLVLSALVCGFMQLISAGAQAQSCMTEDLFLNIEPKKTAQKSASQQAKARKKCAGTGIAVVGTNNSSNRSKASDERGTEERQRIAGRN
jgi:hypothetical protein